MFFKCSTSISIRQLQIKTIDISSYHSQNGKDKNVTTNAVLDVRKEEHVFPAGKSAHKCSYTEISVEVPQINLLHDPTFFGIYLKDSISSYRDTCSLRCILVLFSIAQMEKGQNISIDTRVMRKEKKNEKNVMNSVFMTPAMQKKRGTSSMPSRKNLNVLNQQRV